MARRSRTFRCADAIRPASRDARAMPDRRGRRSGPTAQGPAVKPGRPAAAPSELLPMGTNASWGKTPFQPQRTARSKARGHALRRDKLADRTGPPASRAISVVSRFFANSQGSCPLACIAVRPSSRPVSRPGGKDESTRPTFARGRESGARAREDPCRIPARMWDFSSVPARYGAGGRAWPLSGDLVQVAPRGGKEQGRSTRGSHTERRSEKVSGTFNG
jgi:hypothetical protein